MGVGDVSLSPAGARKGCCLIQTSPFRTVAAPLALQPPDNMYVHGYPHGEIFLLLPSNLHLLTAAACA